MSKRGNEITQALWEKVERDGVPDTTNLQQAHIQFVGQIASAIMGNYEFYAQGIAEECNRSGKPRIEIVAQMSVEIADALVAELQKKRNE